MKTNFWLGIGAATEAQELKTGGKRKPPDKRLIIVGAVIVVLAVAGLAIVLFSQLHF
jgi:hypothetical protein